MHVRNLVQVCVLVCVCAGLAGLRTPAARAAETLSGVEIRAALSHLAHVRTLAHRISRQNLHAQTGFEEDQRLAMARTADEMDALLGMLSEGHVRLSIPAPPTPELREALNAVDTAWSPLRTLAVSSRWEYPRRAGLEGRPIFRDDPLLVQHADALASALDASAVAAITAYQNFCEQRDLSGCDIDASTQAPAALERLTKYAALVVAKIDAEAKLAALRETRDEFTATLEASIASPRARHAMSPERGTAGALVRATARRIEEDGQKLRTQVDRLLESPEAVELLAILRIQSELIYSFQRLSSALIIIDTPLAVGGSSGAAYFKHEHVSAQRWLGRLRTLMEQLNKDNLLYRLRIEDASQPRAHAIDAANEMEQAFRVLREGDPRTGVPKPPTPAILEQLAATEREWNELGRLLLAEPFEYFDYLRSLSVKPPVEPDPLALHYLDRRIAALIETVDEMSRMYVEVCERDGYEICEMIASSGRPERLSEQLVKEAVLHFAGLAAADGLAESRDTFDRFVASPSGRPDLDRVIAEASGPAALRVRVALDDTRNRWSALRRELEFVIQGSAYAPNLQRLIVLQREMAGQLDRLGAAIAVLELLEGATLSPLSLHSP